MDWGAIISLVFAVFVFIVFPLVGIVGAIMIELAKAKRSGVDVESIIKDARKRAYERGLDGE
jgi:uncharacterized protein YqhQ